MKHKLYMPGNALALLPAVIFLLFLFGMMVKTGGNGAVETIKGTELSFSGFENLSYDFEESLQGQCYQKEFFINLNGLTTRILGIHSLNQRQKLENGCLSYDEEIIDITDPGERVIGLHNFLQKKGIDFLYVLAPTAASIYDAQFAPGYESDARENITNMVQLLSEAKVNVINVDALYEENGLGSQDVLFKTDHHWRPEGAFFATHKSLQYMRDVFGIDYDNSMADFSDWDVVKYEDCFLGSHGKRVGSQYAGVDDISIIRRKGLGTVSFSCLHRDGTWSYPNSLFKDSYLWEPDYFNQNPYAAYLGGDYPLAVIKNDQALNQKRALVIGDSFRLPVETFLASYFTELYHLDTRYYTDGTVAQFVDEIQPELVLMYTYEYGLSKEDRYQFGVEEYQEAKAAFQNQEAPVFLGELSLGAGDNDQTFLLAFSNLAPGTPYTCTIDGVSLQGGDSAYVQMTLQDLSANKEVCSHYFETDCKQSQKWIFMTGAEDHTYAVYLYAGTKGHTAGLSVSLEGVCLEKGIS